MQIDPFDENRFGCIPHQMRIYTILYCYSFSVVKRMVELVVSGINGHFYLL